MLTGVTQVRLYLLTDAIVLSGYFGLSVQYSAFGKEFLVAAPSRVNTNKTTLPSITFFMLTLANNGTRIALTTPTYKPVDQTLNKTFTLKTREMLTFTPAGYFVYYSDVTKIWTFKFSGSDAFSLTVLIRQSSESFSSFQAVPVESWGKKYLAFTFGPRPSLQIISDTNNNSVIVYLNLNSSIMNQNNYKEAYTVSLKFDYTLKRWEALSISNCHASISYMKSLMGSFVEGQFPIGVVSGNCESNTSTISCARGAPGSQRRVAGNTSDVATEMLLPVDAYGKEFIIVHIARKTPSTVVIMACKENTTVNVTLPRGVLPVTVVNATRWSYSFEVSENQKLVSNRRIQVTIMTPSMCQGAGALNDPGDPAICLILPNSFFYVEFFWSPPKEIESHYATVVMELDHIKHVHVNNVPLRHYDLKKVMGNAKYEVSTFKLLPIQNHISTPTLFKFACYVYGVGPGVQYMHPAGFEGCVDTVDSMFPGDLIDNDCDGKVGEEMKNGLDDDGDGRIDEDILHSSDEDGMWGEWQPWTCNPNCSRPLLFRTRNCDSPPPSGRGIECDGEPLIMINVTCKPDIACPRRCAKFAWGGRCERSCVNCGSDCDTETGSCDYCKRGFKHREAGCDQKCELNEYGRDCAFICTEKCGTDCKNRVTGECPNENRYLLIFVVLLVMLVGLLMLTVKRRTPETDNVAGLHEGSIERARHVVIHHVHDDSRPRLKQKGRTGAIIIAPDPP